MLWVYYGFVILNCAAVNLGVNKYMKNISIEYFLLYSGIIIF